MRTRAPRRGEEAKNSARLPLRAIFRSHSSADTMTAALRPRRVIVCGPSASAWSITALRCALALATAQVRVDLAIHCPQIVPIVIIVIWGHSSSHWLKLRRIFLECRASGQFLLDRPGPVAPRPLWLAWRWHRASTGGWLCSGPELSLRQQPCSQIHPHWYERRLRRRGGN